MADGSLLTVAAGLPPGDALHVALRAERLLLPGEYAADDAGLNRIAATLAEVIYQGDSLLILAEIAGGHTVSIRKPLRAAADARGFEAGQAVQLGLSPAATIVVPD